MAKSWGFLFVYLFPLYSKKKNPEKQIFILTTNTFSRLRL